MGACSSQPTGVSLPACKPGAKPTLLQADTTSCQIPTIQSKDISNFIEGMEADLPQDFENFTRKFSYKGKAPVRVTSFKEKRCGMFKQSSSSLFGDIGLSTSKAETSVGRPAALGRFHIAPARRLHDDYRVNGTVLGDGISGSVHSAKCLHSDIDFAVKSLEIHPLDLDDVEDIASEAGIFLALDHPHIVRLVDVYLSTERVDLVMECMAGGELFDRAVERGPLPEREVAHIIRQVLEALSYLHSSNTAHCDVKLENCLFDQPGSDHLKLVDFGFSQLFALGETLSRTLGTPGYIAPGVLEGHYTSDCDMWSVGVMAFILLIGGTPFKGTVEQQERDIRRGRWNSSEKLWSKVSASSLDFVKGLLMLDPKVRMTAPVALAHSWINTHCPRQPVSLDAGIISSLRVFKEASHFRRACWSVMAWSLTHEERRGLQEAFLAMDVSFSGTVQLWEMKQVLVARAVSEQEASLIYEAVNMEQNPEIGYSDFLAAMCASKIQLQDHHVKETFRRFDCDNSGRITYDNLHDVFQTPLDDGDVNTYLAGLAGSQGLDRKALETILHADGLFSQPRGELALGMIPNEQAFDFSI